MSTRKNPTICVHLRRPKRMELCYLFKHTHTLKDKRKDLSPHNQEKIMNQDLYSAIYKEVSQTLPEYTKDLNVSIQDGIKILIEFLENAPPEEGNEHACSNFYQTLCDVFAYRASPISIATQIEPLFRAITHALKPDASLFHYIQSLAITSDSISSKKGLPEGWENSIREDFYQIYHIRNNKSHYAKHYSYLEQSIFLQRLCRTLCYVAMKCKDFLNPLFANDIVHVRIYLDKKEESITTLSELHSFLSGDYDTLHQFCQGKNYDWIALENKQYSHAKHRGYITLWALGMYVKLTNDTERYGEIDYSFDHEAPGYDPLYAIPAVLCHLNTEGLNLKNQFITELPPEVALMNNTTINLINWTIQNLPNELGTHRDGPTLLLADNPITELPPKLRHIQHRVRFTLPPKNIPIKALSRKKKRSTSTQKKKESSSNILNLDEYREK